MIYTKLRKKRQVPGGFFHLEDEKTKTRVFGYGHGDHIKLKDEYGNVWLGSAVRNPDRSGSWDRPRHRSWGRARRRARRSCGKTSCRRSVRFRN